MVHGRDRQALERLCRYVTRPPIALERLSERDDGCVEVAFRKPWCDGPRAVVLTEEDLMARICAMVPPPRLHLTRYAGVLAPNAKLRAEVVRGRTRASEAGREAATSGPTNTRANEQGELFGGGSAANDEEKDREASSSRHPFAFCGVAAATGVCGARPRVRALCRQAATHGDRDGARGDAPHCP
jgi:hypothetical protein